MKVARKITMALVLISMSVTGMFAQDHTCASGHIHDQLLGSDSLYARNMMYLNRRILEMQEEFAQRQFETVYTIPTVIHILHEGEELGLGSNISEEQIMSAMTALNDDFRKVTGTMGDGDGVDVEVDFCLASRDPDGNSTNGIVRVDASVIPDYAEMGIEASSTIGGDEGAVKALSTWPREDYMNVWIVNEIEDNDAGGGVQGYAYFPMNSPLDGIVILHNAFGTTGNIKPNTALNRTFAHEVGHYIGLYHTFHDTDDCDDETNCVTQGDRVCDTPDTPLSASCWEPECDATQQVENYMDYTAEICRNMFTQGQKDRMRATLETDRESILSSLGCIPVTEYDAGISTIVSPNGSVCDVGVTAVVMLTNYGSETLTSVTIEYELSNGGSSSYDWTGSLSPGGTEEVTLPALVGSAGSQTITVTATLPNGQADQYGDNDELSKDFAISTGAALTLNITVDYFGAETTWDVYDDEGILVDEGGPYINNNQGTVFSESICATAGCFTLTLHDTYGDGQSFTNGSFELLDGQGNVLAGESGNWGEESVTDFCIEEETGGEAPTANFNANDSGICAGEDVSFNDLSSGTPTTWSWTFEGGSPSSHSGSSPPQISYNTPGIYDVTLVVTNNEGTDSYTLNDYINVYDDPSITLTVTDVSCEGSNNGAITSDVDGFGSISYDWSSGHTGTGISSQPAGSYSLTATDAQGCSATENATIGEPDGIDLVVSSTDVSCFGDNDGSAAVTASGGVGSLDLQWNTGSGNTVLNGLSGGTYTITATDDNGCEASASVDVDEPALLEANLFDFDIACNGGSGSAEVDPQGGSAPYSISWSTGGNGTSVSNLTPGNYSVVVEDDHDCSVSENFEITETAELSLQLNVQEISCPGMADGSASVTVMGGSGSYTYTWSTGHSSTSISALSPGDYSINVIDDTGCEGSADFTLEDPEAMSIVIFKTDISCYGLSDGTATATPSGGAAPYSYNWSNGDEVIEATDLSQGSVSVTVTDDHGCTQSASIEIIEPSALIITTAQTTPETCIGNDGSGLVNSMGGTPDYSYSWSNGGDEQSIENASSGNYMVAVTDANGCTATADLTIEYDCTNPPEASMLTDDYCGAHHLFLEQYIDCVPVDNAEMYQWKFENQSLGIFSEEYTIGNNTSFLLGAVPDLGYNMTAFVSVKVLRDGMWSPYGTVCQIWTNEDMPTTQLIDEDCGADDIYLGDYIETTELSGAFSYEWHVIGNGLDAVFTSYVNTMAFSADLGLVEGGEYNVQVRAEIAGEWTDWGAVCSVSLQFGSSVSDIFDEDLAVSFFPNPNPGDQISIELSKLYNYPSVISFELYSSTGKLIESFKLTGSSDNYTRTEHHFQNRLSSGMYFVKYELNGSRYQEKLIVR
jgi:PKD repeat protein